MMEKMYTLVSGDCGQWTTFDLNKGTKTIFVKPGENKTIFNHSGCGIVTRLWMTMPGWFHRYWDEKATTDPTVLRLSIIKIYYDGETEPSVLAPVGDFFGVGHCEYRHYTARLLGMSRGGFYSFFPMPFHKSFRLEIENMHSQETIELFFNVQYKTLQSLPGNAGLFHCAFNSAACGPADPLLVADIRGEGHFAGCAVSIQGAAPNVMSYLEAPEHIWIDDENEPSIIGTGMEDYFGGGWYFRGGEFYCDTHGVPLKDPLRSMITMYRLLDEDRISFLKSFRMSFVNPWKAERLSPYIYSSTAYYYLKKPVKACFSLPAPADMTRLYHIRDMDFQSIP